MERTIQSLYHFEDLRYVKGLYPSFLLWLRFSKQLQLRVQWMKKRHLRLLVTYIEFASTLGPYGTLIHIATIRSCRDRYLYLRTLPNSTLSRHPKLVTPITVSPLSTYLNFSSASDVLSSFYRPSCPEPLGHCLDIISGLSNTASISTVVYSKSTGHGGSNYHLQRAMSVLESLFGSSVLELVVPDTSLEFPPKTPTDEWLAILKTGALERKQAFFGEFDISLYKDVI